MNEEKSKSLNSKRKITTRALALIAILSALSVTLKFFSIETGFSKVTLYDVPLMVVGLIFGPIGGIAGFIVDWIHGLAKGYTLGPFTLSSIAWGLVPALLAKLFKFKYQADGNRKKTISIIFVIVLITSFVALSLNTYALSLLHGWGPTIAKLPIRVITLIIKLPIQTIVLYKVLDVYYKHFDKA